MKKQIVLFSVMMFVTAFTFAQVPNYMSYQSVIRNNNTLVSNSSVGIRVTILQGTVTGTPVYQETQAATTNANGLVSLAIGRGTVVLGSISGIDWANGPYFIKTETDPNGGSSYTTSGTSQILSVPYALVSGTTLQGGGGSLDQAYHSGDSTQSRKITANAGPVLIQGTDGLGITGTLGSGAIVDAGTGAGAKMFFNPNKAAFRAGYLADAVKSYWDNGNLGSYSVAIGNAVEATGQGSVALGWGATALSDAATATGYYTRAWGYGSTALGYFAYADGSRSTAMGNYVNTSGHQGTFIIGDNSVTAVANATKSSADNQFTARFIGGYNLYTNSTATVGITLPAGGNSWATISDSTKKENFLPVDGTSFLRKIAAMKLSSWNYKGQDPKQYRHYGPMAQDFYCAFGKDKFGEIGNDTTITTSDFAGIRLIALQALIKENNKLKSEVNFLESASNINAEIIKNIKIEIIDIATDLKEFKKFSMMQKKIENVVKK
jgi:hypothetical protein